MIFSALVEPIRWFEKARYAGVLRRHQFESPPVFLLGFGRSGTTHLHNLLWQDERFGVLTNYQASVHPIALSGRGWLDRYLEDKMPSKRPMDNVAVSLDSPQEEEIALLNLTADAPLHFMSFPEALPDIYERWVSRLGQDARDVQLWKREYMEVVRKASVIASGKRLVLKTPPNTARIPILLDLFPDAAFVNIVRNPYRVFQSMRNMYRKVMPGQAMQDFSWEAIDAWVLSAYRDLMLKYLNDRDLLDSKSLFEIRYEELDARPMEVLESVYGSLGLPDFSATASRVQSYLDGLGVFEKNDFAYPDDVVRTVNEHWGFAFDAFGYERLEPGVAIEGQASALSDFPKKEVGG
ncbi:sulfotransferase [Myxococcota bacterium]|nr:sulfotransferase [Myxococcota bacterium]